MELQAEIKKLQQIAKENHITNKEIAERSGLTARTISHFFLLNHSPSLETYLKIASSLGLNINLSPKSFIFKRSGEINGEIIYMKQII